MEENQAILRERLLFKLVVSAISPTEAIEKGQILGIDLIARCYLIVILKIELDDRTENYDYDEYQQVQSAVIKLAEKNPDIFVLKRDWGDLILMMKGSTPEYLEEERDLLLEEIEQVVAKTRYKVTSGVGGSKKRIADIYQSFVEALANIEYVASENKTELHQAVERAELLKVDKLAVENYLRHGVKDEFTEFFNAYIRPLGETALRSNLYFRGCCFGHRQISERAGWGC